MTDISNMGGEFSAPELLGEFSVISGTAPVSSMQNYQSELTAYTHGKGKLFCTVKGYEPCFFIACRPESAIRAFDRADRARAAAGGVDAQRRGIAADNDAAQQVTEGRNAFFGKKKRG